MELPLVAIVGRPNVGKSTLFNRVLGQRIAITDDQPGVTRDRLYRKAEWTGVPFLLVDTGGYVAWEEESIPQAVTDAVRIAIDEADVIVFLVDATVGATTADREVGELLRRSGKPVLLAANKIDSPQRDALAADFYTLGLGEPVSVSALNGLGTGDLLDRVVEAIPRDRIVPVEEADEEEPCIHVAIIGRPNVGKSTLLNMLLDEKRSVVSEVPGTTRDPVDALVRVEGQAFRLIDTAGIRRRGKALGVEKYSVARARAAIRRADVCLLMIDAGEGLTATDAHVFQVAQDEGRAAVLVVNKWDLVERDAKAVERFERDLRDRLPFLSYAPLVTISALSGLRTHRLFELVRKVYAGFTQRVPTAELNRLLKKILETKQPARVRGKAPNILYISQVRTAPPTFVLSVSHPEALHFSYKRFLVNSLRAEYGFEGSPIVLLPRRR